MKRSRRMLMVLFVLPSLMAADLPSQTLILKVRQEDSHVGFAVTKWAVFKEEGRFREFDGVIEFDPGDFSKTRVEFTIQAASIDSRNESRDRALRSHEFFHVSRYPTLSFKSVRARTTDDNSLLVEGDFTIRSVTKRILVPVTVLGVNHTGRDLGTLVGFESSFAINRHDFNVGEGWAIIGENVDITLHIGAGTGSRTASR